MKHYSPGQKRDTQEKMLPPHNVSISFLAKTNGIPKSTLYDWRKKSRKATYQYKTLSDKSTQKLLQDNHKENHQNLVHYDAIEFPSLTVHIILNVINIPYKIKC